MALYHTKQGSLLGAGCAACAMIDGGVCDFHKKDPRPGTKIRMEPFQGRIRALTGKRAITHAMSAPSAALPLPAPGMDDRLVENVDNGDGTGGWAAELVPTPSIPDSRPVSPGAVSVGAVMRSVADSISLHIPAVVHKTSQGTFMVLHLPKHGDYEVSPPPQEAPGT